MRTKPNPSLTACGELHNMSVPPRTTFESIVTSVAGKILVFRLAPPRQPLGRSRLARPIFDCGLENIPPREDVEAAVRGLPAFLIGIRSDRPGKAAVREIEDPACSIAILSRRVGEIYVRTRQPDYTAAHLFNQKPFAVEAWEGAP